MIILAIETSCDETGVAVVEKKKNTEWVQVLSDVKATSEEMHVKTGGIVPEVAAREQSLSIIPVIKQAFVSSGFKVNDIDALAVTVGPGLIGSLLIGVETARSLAYAWKKPLIPVNHLLAHLYGNWIGIENKEQRIKNEKEIGNNESSDSASIRPMRQDQGKQAQDRQDKEEVMSNEKMPEFPALGLVVSGGHTDLVLMKNHRNIEYLGGTRDDAAGECFDKCARVVLGVPYPGGPAIAKEAEKVMGLKKNIKFELPRPMINDETLEMSFSGLKTAVVNLVREIKESKKTQKLSDYEKKQISFEIQESIVDVLESKIKLAIGRFNPESLLIGGGVAANIRLRKRIKKLRKEYKINIHIPSLELCTDNAVIIGALALHHPRTRSIYKIQADPILDILD